MKIDENSVISKRRRRVRALWPPRELRGAPRGKRWRRGEDLRARARGPSPPPPGEEPAPGAGPGGHRRAGRRRRSGTGGSARARRPPRAQSGPSAAEQSRGASRSGRYAASGGAFSSFPGSSRKHSPETLAHPTIRNTKENGDS